MPVRKSKGRRRGIRRGVQRNKLRSPHLTEEGLEGTDAVRLPMMDSKSHVVRAFASKWAEKVFSRTSSLCCNLCLVPFVKGHNGCFELAPLWRRIIHYGIVALLLLTCVHKFVMTILAFTVLPVGTVASTLSYTGFQLQITAMGMGSGFIFFPSLSCELLNSWNHVLSEVASRLGQSPRTPWTYFSSGFQVLIAVVGCIVAAITMPCLSVLFPTTPIFLFPSLKIAGLIDLTDDYFSTIVMRIICSPFDFGVYALAITLMCFGCTFIVSEVGLLKAVVNGLR